MMLRYLLEKEFKQIWRDRFLPKIIFIVPFLQLAILPFAADFEMKRINLAVVDHDRSSESVRLVEKVLASGYFVDAGRYVTYNEALTSVEGDRSDIILEIPPHFERDLTRGEPVRLMIAANAVNGTKGGLGSAYLTRIVQDYGAGLSGPNLMPEGPTLSVSVTNLYNPHLNYKVYMVPGIIVFLVTIIGGALSSLNIVSEKEKGTIEQMNVSPIPKWLFLLSKLIPFWVLGFVILTVGALVAWLIYGLSPVGSFGVIYAFAAIYLLVFTGIGLAVSSISSSQQQAMFTTFFFLIIFALLSGLFTPINSMPEWARTLTLFNPMRYFVEVIRMVYLKGAGFTDVWGHFGIISLFALLFNGLALIGYRKRE